MASDAEEDEGRRGERKDRRRFDVDRRREEDEAMDSLEDERDRGGDG